MNNKILLITAFLFFCHIGVFSQNRIDSVEVLVIKKIESPSFVVHFEYNDKGLVTSEAKVADNEYSNYKFEYKYDKHGKLLLLTKTDINSIIQEVNEYNDDSQIIIKKIYYDYGSGFKFTEQKLYSYQEGQLETIIEQMVVNNGQSFNDNIRQVFSYNKQNLLSKINLYAWVMDHWEAIGIFDYEYDGFNSLLNYSNSFIIDNINYKSWRYHFQYNDEHDLAERSYHFPLDSVWNPTPSRKIVYHYELLPECDSILYPNIYHYDEHEYNPVPATAKKLFKSDYWDSSCGNPLHFVESADFIYDRIFINIDTIPNDTLKIVDFYGIVDILVYPNPTTGELRIETSDIRYEISDIEIYDIFGEKKVSNLKSQISNQIIYISHLTAGIYFVKIKTEKGFVMKKILKI